MTSSCPLYLLAASLILLGASLGVNYWLWRRWQQLVRDLSVWRWLGGALGRKFWIVDERRSVLVANWKIGVVKEGRGLPLSYLLDYELDRPLLEKAVEESFRPRSVGGAAQEEPFVKIGSQGKFYTFERAPDYLLGVPALLCYSDRLESRDSNLASAAPYYDNLCQLTEALNVSCLACDLLGQIIYLSPALCRRLKLEDWEGRNLRFRDFCARLGAEESLAELIHNVESPDNILHGGRKYVENIYLEGLGSHFVVTASTCLLNETNLLILVAWEDVSEEIELRREANLYRLVGESLSLKAFVEPWAEAAPQRSLEGEPPPAEERSELWEWLGKRFHQEGALVIAEQDQESTARFLWELWKKAGQEGREQRWWTAARLCPREGVELEDRFLYFRRYQDESSGQERLLSLSLANGRYSSLQEEIEYYREVHRLFQGLKRIAFYVYNVTGYRVCEEANEAAQELSGLGPDREAREPNISTACYQKWDQMMRELESHTQIAKSQLGQIHTFHEDLLDRQGQKREFTSYKRVFRDRAGEYHLVGLSVEITQWETLKRDFSNMVAIVRNLHSLVPLGLVVKRLDATGKRFVIWNSYMERVTGLAATSVLGRSEDEVGELNLPIREAESSVLSSSEPMTIVRDEVALYGREGQITNVQMQLSNYLSPWGERYSIAIYRDLSEVLSLKTQARALELENVFKQKLLELATRTVFDIFNQDLQTALAALMRRVARTFEAQRAVLLKFANNYTSLQLLAQGGAEAEARELNLEEWPTRSIFNVLSEGQVWNIEDVEQLDNLALQEALKAFSCRSILLVPIYEPLPGQNRALSKCLAIIYTQGVRRFLPYEEELARKLIELYLLLLEFYKLTDNLENRLTILRTLLDRLPLPILVVDSEYNIRLANRGFCTLAGNESQVLLGKNCCSLFCSKLRLRVSCPTFRSRQTGEVAEVVRYFPNVEGKKYRLLSLPLPVADSSQLEEHLPQSKIGPSRLFAEIFWELEDS